MKRLIFLISFLTAGFIAFGQTTPAYQPFELMYPGQIENKISFPSKAALDDFVQNDGRAVSGKVCTYFDGTVWKSVLIQNEKTYSEIGSAASGSDSYDGNYFTTSVPQAGVNYGGATVREFLDNVFKQSVAPQCDITLATPVREFQSAGNVTVDLNWSVTRPLGCTEIVSITVDGQVIAPDGGNQSGTLSVTVPANADRTFSVQAASVDKSAFRSATLTWHRKRYWGNFDTQYPADTDILRLSGAGVGSGSELAATFVKTYDGIDGAGKYLVFAFPDAWGVPEFAINGLVSTAFTKTTRTFTNASGGTTTYQVWVSNTPQNSPITQFRIR